STIFFDAIGSIIAAVIEYISNNTVILINGISIIITNIINPTIPIPFLSMADDPITASIESDKNPPTIGKKLSIANFAVRIVNPSIFVDKPYIVNIPIKIVNTAEIINIIILRPNSDNLLNSVLLDKLDNIFKIKEK